MKVSVWAALGIVCLLIGLPLSVFSVFGVLLLGLGTAFLLVAAGRWVWDRWITRPSDDALGDELDS